jgi:hypothetical protein
MGRTSKIFALFLTLTIIISCLTQLMVKPANAQTTASQKPAPPEFTLTFIPASETLTHTDPLTGAKTYELVDKSTIEVKIKNQPFEENVGGIHYYLFYSVFVAGHFDPSNQSVWQYAYNFPYNYTTTPSYPNTLEATTSEYTTAIIDGDYPSYAQIDVHVGAMLMHDGQFRVYNYIGDLTGHLVSGIVEGEISGSVQTFTIPEHQTSTNSPNPTSVITSTPTSTSEPEEPFPTILIAVIAIIVTVIITVACLLVYFKKRKH